MPGLIHAFWVQTRD
ncbi:MULTISPECIES: hypothetical protein [Enterobacterales]